MSKQHTDSMDLKGFVKRIFGKPSKRAEGTTPEEANDVLQLLLKLMRRQLESSGKEGDNERLYKTMLAEMIFPKVINSPPTDPKEERELVKHEEAKDWAFACAQVMGFLAGTSLQEDAIDAALNEAMRVAKATAHSTSEMISTTIGPAVTGELPKPRVRKPSVGVNSNNGSNKATKTSAPMLEQKRRMIADLENQAELEKDPAGAAALRAMASNMKKEVEIEEDLNKVGKSAA